MSNKTFAAIMRVYGVEDSNGKSSADAFEMFVSLLVEKSGEDGLKEWAGPTFLPLMRAAYGECGTLRCARIFFRTDLGRDHNVCSRSWQTEAGRYPNETVTRLGDVGGDRKVGDYAWMLNM